MNKFIRELRRREVFRSAGLYVGVAWILIEVSSVLFDAFEAPDWALQVVIILAVIGLPVTLVLAWIYDVTETGIHVQADPTDTIVVPFGGRRMDFAVIGVLTVALAFSVYLNVISGPTVVEELDPISVLIADFDNTTGQDMFDGLLEKALTIGIESAPHVTAYQRNSAKGDATQLNPESSTLNATVASLIAVREGINMVLAGSIEAQGSGFDLKVSGIDPTDGRTLFEITQEAGSTDAVLQVIGELSGGVREELGDATLDRSDSPFAETFTAASIEAARAYVNATQLAFEGNHEAAVEAYLEAIRLDENFGRAYAALGLSAHRVGRSDLSEEVWQKALALMDTMTERERLRTLGLYYASVTRNFNSAIDSYASLVEKYPADAVGHNNLAVVYFYTLDFDKAREQGGKLLDIYPNSTIYRSNYALYAMYAGEFEAAASEARQVVEQDDTFYKGWLPQAIDALDRGDFSSASVFYENMIQGGPRGKSLANVGLADMNILQGQFETALQQLEEGVATDEANQKQRAAATKYVMKAEAQLQLGDEDSARESLRRAMELNDGDATLVSAALLLLAVGDTETVRATAHRLMSQLQPQRRAYGAMLEAMLDLADDRTVQAIDKLNAALGLADLWLVRVQLGKAYLQAGYAAEAMAEFEAAKSRRGEASAIFLDDVPTYRYLTELPYWTALAQLEIGMTEAAHKNLQAFLEMRPNGGALANDARQRLN